MDALYACDLRWWAKRRPGDRNVGGIWVSQDQTACDRHGLAYVASRTGNGLCREPWVVNQGLNSGYQAINLAFHMGATRLILLGYDMQAQTGKTHFFGDYPPETGLQVPSPYMEFAKRFTPLARDLEDEGVEVVNCSTTTALTCFRRAELEATLE